MKKRGFLILLILVALVSLLVGHLLKPSPRWSIEGVTPHTSPEEIKALLGEPVSVSQQDGVRRTLYSSTNGELERIEYLKEERVSISGKVLEKDGMTTVEEHFTYGKVIGIMGEPERVDDLGDDTQSFRYNGVSIVLREQRVTSFVVEDQLK